MVKIFDHRLEIKKDYTVYTDSTDYKDLRQHI